MKHTNNLSLRIGTDCSGIEAPIQALRQLGIPHICAWCSDIDKWCIQSIKANYTPERIYGDEDGDYKDGDMRNRNHEELPDVDLYVCGFPCQPFSQAGMRKGLSDDRGNVFFSCIDTIRVKNPKYFILENVKGILWNDKKNKKDKYGNTWKIVWSEIEKLRELGYYVDWRVMNTRHYGIPQNRERVYIVGTMEGEYVWPEKCDMDDIRNYVDWEDNTKDIIKIYKDRCKDLEISNPYFINTMQNYNNYPNGNKYSICLIKNMYGFYSYHKSRKINVKECLMLQGFDTNFNEVVSKKQIKQQLGNSMSVNVVKKIIFNLINR